MHQTQDGNDEIDNKIIVSIIVSVYNEEIVIEDCLTSIMKNNFSFNQYEVIVIDDGSTDNSVKVIESFTSKNKNIKIKLLSKENGGKASAQNMALKHVQGKYILITDADTAVEKDWIKKMVTKLKNFDVVIGSHYAKKPKTILQKAQQSHFLLKFRYGGTIGIPPNGSNNGFRKEIIELIGPYDEKKTSVTSDFIKRVQSKELTVHYDPSIEVHIDITSKVTALIKQKLRWREEGLINLLHFGYTYGLTLLLYGSILLSILINNYIYIPIIWLAVFLLSFSIYFLPFFRMLGNKEDRGYAKYFIFYQLFELIVRVILLPYMMFRLIKPRKDPTFTPDRI